MKKSVLALDAGTSSVKAVLVDEDGHILASTAEPYPSSMPHPGWMEQDPHDYWQAAGIASRRIMETIGSSANLCGLVFTTQAMGIIPLDEQGKVLHPNITWVDGRAEEEAGWFMNRFLGRRVFKKIIGIEITGKDVLPKLRWLMKHRPDIYSRAHRILDVNGYLRYRATGQMTFEWSGACSYTFDLKKKDWTRWLFRFIGFDMRKLPPLVRSTDQVGVLLPDAADQLGLPPGLPVFGGCDDTQSAAIGSGATGEGDAHIYLGTSAWVGVMTSKIFGFKNGAVCLQSADPEKNIVVGITESAGSNIDWIIRNFYSKEEKEAPQQVYSLANLEAETINPGSDHLLMTPWLFGERCPVGTTTTRGTLFNLTQYHTRGHIVRAMSEGIAYNLRWIIENMRRDFGFPMKKLRIIGGGTQSESWMQIIADVTGCVIEKTHDPRMAGALGAAFCAFVGLGIYPGFTHAGKVIQPLRSWEPNPANSEVYRQGFTHYRELFHTNKKLYTRLNS
ncbi:MAG: FGGY-family carbohydrate kinase [Bacteroidales bacterium]